MTQYRVSKAALNMAMQEIEIKGTDDGMHVLCLVPGWVRTDRAGQTAVSAQTFIPLSYHIS